MERRQVSMLTSVTIRRVRNPSAECPRFPGPGSSSQGKAEPKARPKGVADGKQVNIPVLSVKRDGGTEKGRWATLWFVV